LARPQVTRLSLQNTKLITSGSTRENDMKLLWGFVLTSVLCLVGCHDLGRAPEKALVISVEQQSSWVQRFNPLSPMATPRWPSKGGIYETLLVFNSATEAWVPALAVDTRYDESGTRLQVDIRTSVLWSDGTAFTSDDVLFTFELLKKFPGLDTGGIWKHLDSVTKNETGIEFVFKAVHAPLFDSIVQTPIVSKHIWSLVEDPVRYAAKKPVGTGPFTEVLRFDPMIYELGANPHYWKEGIPKVKRLRFPAYSSNDQATLALVRGEVDWAGNFVPAIEKTYVAKAPESRRYWFARTGTMVFLYLNQAKTMFTNIDIRRAISCIIDRDRLVDIAMFGYTRPAWQSPYSDGFAKWQKRPDKPMEGCDALVTKAKALITDPEPYELLVVSGWSDWVRAAQLAARDLSKLGLDVKVRTLEFGTWFGRVQRGEFDMSIGWSAEGSSPYALMRGLMDPKLVFPVGENGVQNWHRYADEEAGRLLDVFAVTVDPKKRMSLVHQLEDRFYESLPAIPLFPNPSWAVFNEERYTGFPHPDAPYAGGSPNALPEASLVLQRLRPVEQTP
jgi:peptide/nickel transport system substrate-binding protein